MNPADSEPNYAYWTDSEGRFTVNYSLTLFHDIDFQVSEGFRRIPHGGVETGGLLFGRVRPNASHAVIQIEAFRQIECEHAAGPSFNLSERDLARLRDQMAASTSDPELEGMQVVGWFVAHTRSPLVMNDREANLFGQLFPGENRVLLLVKPERFQATRFAFLIRGADGRVERDGTAGAIILPLPGRTSRAAGGPAASIPAPELPQVESQPSRQAPVAWTPAITELESPPPSFWRDVPAPGDSQQPIVRIEEPRRESAEDQGRTSANQISRGSPPDPDGDIREQIRRARASTLQSAGAPPVREQPITRRMGGEESPSALRLILLLVLAAGLGCIVGYFAYLQLPAANITLSVQPPGGVGANTHSILVSWPPEETRDAIFASISVDSNEAVPLSAQQKAAGQVLVPVSGDNVKIELIAQRRWRNSRGIVRYVRAKRFNP